MTKVFVYDHVRTPRGRGKKDGSLHEVPSVRLAAKMLEAVRDRNDLDTSTVDDIIMGCVDPVMDAGSVIPKAAAFEAGYSSRAPGMQISRFCASGLDAINFGAAKIAQGADAIVPLEHSKRLFERAAEPKELWIVPEAGHIQAVRKKDVRKRLTEFLRRHSGPEAGVALR